MQEVEILQYIPSNIKKGGSPPPPGGKLTNRLNLDIRFPYLEPDGTRVFTVPLLMSSEWEEGPCVKKFIGFTCKYFLLSMLMMGFIFYIFVYAVHVETEIENHIRWYGSGRGILKNVGYYITPVASAARSLYDVTMLEKELRNPDVDVNSGFSWGPNGVLGTVSPLGVAVQSGNSEGVSILVKDNRTDLEYPAFTFLGGTLYTSNPLLLAIERQNTKIVQLLLAAGSNPNYGFDAYFSLFKTTPLIQAVMLKRGNTRLEMLNLLLDHDAEVNKPASVGIFGWCSVLNQALMDDAPPEVIKLLLDKGANPNLGSNLFWSIQKSPLAMAKSPEVTELLLQAGANPRGGTCFGYISCNSKVDRTSDETILQKFADVGVFPTTHSVANWVSWVLLLTFKIGLGLIFTIGFIYGFIYNFQVFINLYMSCIYSICRFLVFTICGLPLIMLYNVIGNIYIAIFKVNLFTLTDILNKIKKFQTIIQQFLYAFIVALISWVCKDAIFEKLGLRNWVSIFIFVIHLVVIHLIYSVATCCCYLIYSVATRILPSCSKKDIIATGDDENETTISDLNFGWANGSSYDGEWKDGKKHGKGKWNSSWANGDVYDGEWKDGKKHGKGKFFWANGSSYDGEWIDGKKHGKGFSWANGDMHNGEWKDGKKHGKGTYTSIFGTYNGEWKDDKKHGKGKFTFNPRIWPIPPVYDGEWKDDKIHGKGKFTDSNGNMYDGEWKDGKKHGKGKTSRADGYVFGEWEDGKEISMM